MNCIEIVLITIGCCCCATTRHHRIRKRHVVNSVSWTAKLGFLFQYVIDWALFILHAPGRPSLGVADRSKQEGFCAGSILARLLNVGKLVGFKWLGLISFHTAVTLSRGAWGVDADCRCCTWCEHHCVWIGRFGNRWEWSLSSYLLLTVRASE